jgi:hypothetical protein
MSQYSRNQTGHGKTGVRLIRALFWDSALMKGEKGARINEE